MSRSNEKTKITYVVVSDDFGMFYGVKRQYGSGILDSEWVCPPNMTQSNANSTASRLQAQEDSK